jgi:ankyrin repeat protein
MTDDEKRKAMYSLQKAMWDGDIEKLKSLISTINGDVVFAKEGHTLLHLAAEVGNKTMAEVLLAAGAEVDAMIGFGMTPLHVAAEKGNKDVAEALLNSGADANRKTEAKGCTAIYIAAAFNRKDVVELLLSRGVDIEAVAEGYGGFTPLHQAANNGHAEVVALLLVNGANVNARTEGGSTPLSLATFYADRRDVRPREIQGHKNVVALLLSYGAAPA